METFPGLGWGDQPTVSLLKFREKCVRFRSPSTSRSPTSVPIRLESLEREEPRQSSFFQIIFGNVGTQSGGCFRRNGHGPRRRCPLARVHVGGTTTLVFFGCQRLQI